MITEYQSNVITFLRAVSMLLIIFCHLCQVYNNNWAWALNIGVQIFFISGFLYGIRHISDWRIWTIGRFRKVYVPYISYLVIVFPMYAVFHRECLSLLSPAIYLFDLQGMYWVEFHP